MPKPLGWPGKRVTSTPRTSEVWRRNGKRHAKKSGSSGKPSSRRGVFDLRQERYTTILVRRFRGAQDIGPAGPSRPVLSQEVPPAVELREEL
jgi:hypothetical protein